MTGHAGTKGMHWIVEVARKRDIPGWEQLAIPHTVGAAAAWNAVAEGLGISLTELAEHVAGHFRLEMADLSHIQPSALLLVAEGVARRYQVLPVRSDPRTLVVATSDPVNMDAEQALAFSSGRVVSFAVAHPRDIEEAIFENYSPDRAVEQLLSQLDSSLGSLVRLVEEDEDPNPQPEANELSFGPVARLVNLVLEDSIRKGASDIHIQPTPNGGVVRFRVDDVLRSVVHLPASVLSRVVARMKIMGRMDIADRLRPQDGRARIGVGDRMYDLRISTIPTRQAEKCVIRILDPGWARTLKDAGIPDPERSVIQRILTQREGILIVTGPTGSGKTTTLYAALREIYTEEMNIMTVEDPVEFELPGITQIQVEPKQGVTFASALRAILRQDPDVIFVGEIRDGETATVAARAALTGHLVLATLHTNDAVATVRRLVDLGLDTTTVLDTLRGSVAQRLIRKACPQCSVPFEPPLSAREELLAAEFGVQPIVRAVGCDACEGTGYKGRMPICQVFTMTPEIAALMAQGASYDQITVLARQAGMRSLRESGAQRVREGITTLEELERVLGDTEVGEGATDPVEISVFDGTISPIPTALPGELVPAAIPATSARESIRAMVVDDDSATRIVTRALLESMGHGVVEAVDGNAALAILRNGEERLDIVILDLELPGASGREILSEIRSEAFSRGGIPVVVLTGSQDPSTEMELLDAGADDYIRKPLEPARFMTRVKATLRRSAR